MASENYIINEEKPIAKILNEIFESSLGIQEKLFSFCNFFTKTSENKKDINWLEMVAIAAPSTAMFKFLIKI